jgi:ABC-2 type transport system ATP-binding protein
VKPGRVTGFLGPNGAGKSTTMRLVNGPDPEGIRWIRRLMNQLAAEGRTVFVSSHLMSEMSVTADHLIVIGAGRLIADCSTQEFVERSSGRSVLVRSPDAAELASLITAQGGTVGSGAGNGEPPGTLSVTGMEAPGPGTAAAGCRRRALAWGS